MTITRFANNASTTLGTAASPTDTTMTVASGTGAEFPAIADAQYFMATLSASATGMPNEIVKVTARVGDTMTVVRGQEGTTAQAWSVGDRFSNFVTAGFLNSLADAGDVQSQAGNYAVDAGSANAGVVTLSPTPANLAALIGVPIRVKKGAAASTGSYTLDVNAFGNVPVFIGGMALEGGELVASEVYEVIYDGTQFNLISNPGTVHGDRLADNSILNAALAVMTSLTLKGNLGGGTATPYDVPLPALIAALGFPGFTPDGQTIPLIGGYLLKFVTDVFPDIPSGGVGYESTTSFINPFPTAYVTGQISTRTTSGTICNWNASIVGGSPSNVTWRVEEWASAVNPGGVTIWAIGN